MNSGKTSDPSLKTQFVSLLSFSKKKPKTKNKTKDILETERDRNRRTKVKSGMKYFCQLIIWINNPEYFLVCWTETSPHIAYMAYSLTERCGVHITKPSQCFKLRFRKHSWDSFHFLQALCGQHTLAGASKKMYMYFNRIRNFFIKKKKKRICGAVQIKIDWLKVECVWLMFPHEQSDLVMNMVGNDEAAWPGSDKNMLKCLQCLKWLAYDWWCT